MENDDIRWSDIFALFVIILFGLAGIIASLALFVVMFVRIIVWGLGGL